jgi:FeS assembly SUF system protein
MAEELKGKTENKGRDANGKKALNSENLYDEVVTILKNCYDPEIPVNIYELGLIYDIKIAENNDVLVVMTLTSPACPVAGSLPIEIQDKLKEHPMINDARVEITFDPPWSFDNMSEEAKYELGFI